MEDFPYPKISSNITGGGEATPGFGLTGTVSVDGFPDGFSVLSDVGLSVLFKVGFIVLGLRVGEEEASISGVGTLGSMDSGPVVVGKNSGDVVGLIVVAV